MYYNNYIYYIHQKNKIIKKIKLNLNIEKQIK